VADLVEVVVTATAPLQGPALSPRGVEDRGSSCVIALPSSDGHPDYLAWVAAETREP
jgi:hypothetical protein